MTRHTQRIQFGLAAGLAALGLLGALPSSVLADLNEGLIANWCLDNCSPNDCWDGFNGTNSGGACVAGQVGTGFEFTGTAGIYGIPSSWDDTISTGLTIAAWVFPYAPNATTDNIIFDGRGGGIQGCVLGISQTSRTLIFHMSQGAGSLIFSSSPVPFDTWTHVAVTFDDSGNILRTFIGGQPDNTLATTDSYHNSGSSGAIANNHWAPGDGQWASVNGVVDELRVYRRALSAGEIQQLAGGAPPPPQQLVYSWNMNSNPGWATQGQWAFGHPTGQGGTSYGYPDPSNGATGSNVCGVNLNGDYSLTVGGPYYLTTGAINMTGRTQTTLKFKRWLNTDYQPYVYATIHVSNNGSTWTQVWSNGTSEIAENAWSSQSYSISSVADNQPTVYIRWGYQIASGAYAYSGWNIDDVEIWGVGGGSQQGACCDGDGLCSDTTQANCSGTWHSGTSCATYTCPQPTGACCASNGSCTVTTQAGCDGTWKGASTTCTPNPCPQPPAEPWYFVHITDPHVKFIDGIDNWTDALAEIRAMGPGVGAGSGMGNSVRALTVFDSSDGQGPALYAGGNFAKAGGVPARGVARWDGPSWSSLRGGADFMTTLAVFDDDGPGPHVPALYAGGLFTTADRIAVNHVGRWNGTLWSPVGNGTSGPVFSLCVHNGDLVAGGEFDKAGGVPAANIARWHASSWQPLGIGLDGYVWALAVYDGDLIAGGAFDAAGGSSASNIASWDGSSWHSLGAGLNGVVRALAVLDDGNGPALYAGGEFTSAGATGASRVAKWNGTAWSSLASGVNDWVAAMTAFDDGSGPALYAGGAFTSAGGASANYIAKWNGATWSRLGASENLDSAVEALTVFDDGKGPALYAGGEFATAGGAEVNCVARWNGTTWSALGGKPDLVLCSGDLVDSGQGPAGESNYQALLNHLHEQDGVQYLDPEHNTPIYFCPGNHDARWNVGPPYSFDTYYGHIGPDYYSLPHKNCHFFSLNSGWDIFPWPLSPCSGCLYPGDWMRPEGEGISDFFGGELSAFLADLQGSAGRHKVVMSHHPCDGESYTCDGGQHTCFDDGVFWYNRDTLRSACMAADVDLLVCGHLHYRGDVAALSGTSHTLQAFGGSIADSGDFRKVYVYPNEVVTRELEEFWSAISGHVGCQADVHVFDESGHHNGPNGQGDIEREIPRSFYSHWAVDDDASGLHATYTDFSVRMDLQKDYLFQIQSLSNEPLNVTIHTSSPGGSGSDATYGNVPVFVGSVATIRADESSVDFAMTIEDPDGTIRVVLPSAWEGNLPPEKPAMPAGQTLGFTGIAYSYGTQTNDSEGEVIYYRLDWGDGQHSDWLGPFPSGETCETSHAWDQPGTYEVRVRAKDAWGHLGDWSEPLIVTIAEQPPQIVCPQPVLTECGSQAGTAVELTAHVEDADGDALSVTWSVDGQIVREEQVPGGPPPTAADVTLVHTYAVGTHPVEIVVSDGQAEPVSCSTSVTVQDTTPPAVSCSVSTPMLWPANHNLVNVGLSASISDTCEPNLAARVTVYGDEDDEEATGDGNFSPDATGLAPRTLQLRAERKGNSDGRVYLIVVEATDSSGNTGFNCATVVVPHSKSPASIAAVNAQAAAARAYCLAHDGAPPPAYFVIGDGPTIGPKK